MRRIAARAKVYTYRGWSYLSMPAVVTTTAYALSEKYGLPFTATIIFGCISCYVIGLLDLHYGIWTHENDLSWEMTPIASQLINDIRELKGK